ncbi:DHA1 family inner membrane transport protein [Catenuloplanes nepalensis]|uniref:DHA1 family inner membrane transport protein n=1 Tax=Catenuloplanes nepalensis TaxID=587533 RepID=A0ABT9MTB9_9ACTN|nr:MFS transporter [Catenuloplanes nepalensis]MDP9794655.1 DHA1 family inner membrane transport protein [Catenuloplanes nepalensis]
MSETTATPMWSARPVPGRRGVPAALAALALGAFGIGIAEMTVTGLLGRVAGDLHASTAAVGSAISLYALGVVIGAPLITIAGARVPRHRLLLLTLVLFIAGNTAALLAPTLLLFSAARFVAGLPHGAYLALAAATAASLVARERRGRATAMVGIGQTIASILGVPLAIFLGQAVSWRAALALAVLVFVAAFAAVLTFVPHESDAPVTGAPAAGAASVTSPTGRRGAGTGTLAPGAAPSPGGTGTLVAGATPHAGMRAIQQALRSPGLWAGFAVAASAFAGLYCVLSFIAPITTDVAGLSAGATPIVMMLYGAGMTVGAIAGGRAADWDVSRAVPLGGVAACLVLAGFAAVMSAPWAPFAGAFAIGLVQLIMFPSLQLRLMDAAPHAPAVAAALNQSAVNLANVIGTSAGGALLAAGLGYPVNGYAGALLAAAGAGLAVLLRPRATARRTS